MQVYPHLLGIGIDEGTLLVVKGSVMEVLGASKVAVYDRRTPPAPTGQDYLELPAGSTYDLLKRQRLDGPR
jgi:cyanophycinase